jgi:hypothetical protein
MFSCAFACFEENASANVLVLMQGWLHEVSSALTFVPYEGITYSTRGSEKGKNIVSLR